MDQVQEVILHLLKKYPNRRIYDTEKSCYITLQDVRQMVMDREPFQVVDSKTGADLTRSVLMQIIAEMENDGHPTLLTNRVLEELICFYGDAMVGMLGPFIERQIVGFLNQQDALREHFKQISTGTVAGKQPPAGLGSMPQSIPTPDQFLEQMTQQYKQFFQPFSLSGKAEKGRSGKSKPETEEK